MFTLENMLAAARDLDNLHIRPYSGRGMYGDLCVGIVCNSGDFGYFIAALINTYEPEEGEGEHNVKENIAENVANLFRHMREGSMGMGRIYYWPNMKCDRDLGVESDDDEDED